MIDPVDRTVRAIARRNSYALITEATRAPLSEDEFALELRQEVAVQGKQAGVRLWAPYPRDAETWSERSLRGRAGAAPVSD